MAFSAFDEGLLAAWQRAEHYAGPTGHVATLPEVLAQPMESFPERHIRDLPVLTTSAEYLGRTQAGNLVLIVAHGVGPLSDLDSARRAYAYPGKPAAFRHYGRITQKQFHQLEAGAYGDVHVVDYSHCEGDNQSSWVRVQRASEALADPLLVARLGGAEQAEAYIQRHAAMAGPRQLINGSPGDNSGDPYVLRMVGPRAQSYQYLLGAESNLPVAHLLGTWGISSLHHNIGEDRYVSQVDAVAPYSWFDRCCLVGVPSGAPIGTMLPSWNWFVLMGRDWRDLMVAAEFEPLGFVTLMDLADTTFTVRNRLSRSGVYEEPEYEVTSCVPVGEPVSFSKRIPDRVSNFTLHADELGAMAPATANACRVTDSGYYPEGIDPLQYRATVQYYCITADTRQRLLTLAEFDELSPVSVVDRMAGV